jgi:hypothetical protein
MIKCYSTNDYEFYISDKDYDLQYESWHCHHKDLILTNNRIKSSEGNCLHKIIGARMGFSSILEVDHKDRNRLNNQRENLRSATRSQNGANRGKQTNNTSGFVGVSYYKQKNKYTAQIHYKGKKKCIGYYDNKIDAAKAYNRYALFYFGEFAVLNIIE